MIEAIVKRLILSMIFHKNKGISIFSRDWDNLIILDACRYDDFIHVIKELGFDLSVDEFTSLGSDTTEFLMKNFTDDRYGDIVYVSANPFVSMILKDKVYKIVPVWDYRWDPELGTVLPIEVYHYALRSYLENPDKRFIIHFIQPHYPYLSHINKSMIEHLESLRKEVLEGGTRKNFSLQLRFRRLLKVLIERSIYAVDFYVKVDNNLHRRAYRDNLRIVLPYAIKLAKILPGINVITSDHGEAFGEKLHPLVPIKVYGHLPEIHIDVLLKVPWLVIENNVSREEALKQIKNELAEIQREIIRRRIKKALKKNAHLGRG